MTTGTIRIRCSQYDHDGDREVSVGMSGQGGCPACQIWVVSGPIGLVWQHDQYVVIPSDADADAEMNFDARTGHWVGVSVEVDADMMAETIADAVRGGMSEPEAWAEMLRPSSWSHLSPADRGVA